MSVIFNQYQNNRIQVRNPSNRLQNALKAIALEQSTDEQANFKLFSFESSTVSKVFSELESSNGRINPYFWDEEHGFLIGSHNKEIKGIGLDSLGLYNINSHSSRFGKRLVDVIFGAVFLLVYPFCSFYLKGKGRFFQNIWNVIKGEDTMISYVDEGEKLNASEGLPHLKTGYWPYSEKLNNEERILRMKDYALHYSVLKDVSMIILNFKMVLKYLASKDDQ